MCRCIHYVPVDLVNLMVWVLSTCVVPSLCLLRRVNLPPYTVDHHFNDWSLNLVTPDGTDMNLSVCIPLLRWHEPSTISGHNAHRRDAHAHAASHC